MPIEIKELHIKAVVANNGVDRNNRSLRPEDLAKLKKDIIKEMTDKFKKMLNQKNER